MGIGWITIILFGSMFLFLLAGLPVAWSLGGLGVLFAFFLWGPQSLGMALFGATAVIGYSTLVCIPLFVFMGMMLHESGIIDRLYTSMLYWFGFLPGSLAVVTIGVCTVIAAMVGGTTAATLTMGTTALPAMLKKGYHKSLAVGCILSGAALGFLIPPSIVAILYASVARESIGRLFAGGLIPGIMLSGMFTVYILVRAYFQPNLGPPLPYEERVSWRKKFVSLRTLILPALIVIMVLGSIFLGLATPVEAASVGAVGSIVATAVSGTFTWQVFKNALTGSLRLTAIALWIFIAALAFGKIYQALGAPRLMQEMLDLLPGGALGILIMMQLSYFLLGMILDDTAILFIALPLYLPIAITLGFDRVWFGVLYIVNMQMAYITPPFGYNLFLMRSVAPEDITTGDIYHCVWPFVAIQGFALILCIIFPDIVLWFPCIVFG